MKVYSKKEIKRAIDSAIYIAVNKLRNECIDSVQHELNNMVMKRDIADLTRLEQRIQSIEIDQISLLRAIPRPKLTKTRAKVGKKLNESMK